MNDTSATDSQTSSSGPLNFLQPRETKRLVKARGAHRVVSRLRIVLPLLSMLALGGLFIWPMINPHKILTRAMNNMPNLVIENLNFSDVDSKKQPYSISALKATRPKGSANVFDLEKPHGEITLQEGAWVSAQSQYGRYDRDTNHLWLGGDVQIFHDKGYQFTTDELQADLNERLAWGEKPVLIQGNFGEIRGIGFRLLDGGNEIVVKGPAKAILNLHASGASDKPNPPPTSQQD
jgi:lipopolysaccharide export system protein LptC